MANRKTLICILGLAAVLVAAGLVLLLNNAANRANPYGLNGEWSGMLGTVRISGNVIEHTLYFNGILTSRLINDRMLNEGQFEFAWQGWHGATLERLIMREWKPQDGIIYKIESHNWNDELGLYAISFFMTHSGSFGLKGDRMTIKWNCARGKRVNGFIWDGNAIYLSGMRLERTSGNFAINIPVDLSSQNHELFHMENMHKVRASEGFGIGISLDGDVVMWERESKLDDIEILDVNGNRVWQQPLESGIFDVPQNMGRIVHVATNMFTVLAVNEYGYVYFWGSGQGWAVQEMPNEIQGRVKMMELGRSESVAILDDGSVVQFGFNTIRMSAFIPPDAHMVKVAYAERVGAALDWQGNLYLFPRVGYLSHIPQDAQGRIVDFAIDGHASTIAAVLDDGHVIAWDNRFMPEQIMLRVPERIQGRTVAISGGMSHFTVLLDDGTVASWGCNAHGQSDAPDLTDIVFIDAGHYRSYAIDSAGNVYSWGRLNVFDPFW